MTELKTLKDICFIGHKDKSSGQIVLECIRKEAIKRIKACRKRKATFGYNYGEEIPLREEDFMDFFNITEEDLSEVDMRCGVDVKAIKEHLEEDLKDE